MSPPFGEKEDGFMRIMGAAKPPLFVPKNPDNPAPDRWLPWAAPASTFVLALTGLACFIPGPANLLFMLASFLAIPLSAIILCIFTTLYAAKKLPKKSASIALALIAPALLFHQIVWIDEIIHLGLSAGLGVGQIGRPSQTTDGQYTIYDWSVGLAGGGATFLIYDRKDKLINFRKHNRANTSFDELETECAGNMAHIIAHYYSCSF
jgi:hypothetical protein